MTYLAWPFSHDVGRSASPARNPAGAATISPRSAATQARKAGIADRMAAQMGGGGDAMAAPGQPRAAPRT